jgi:hypothetical protein
MSLFFGKLYKLLQRLYKGYIAILLANFMADLLNFSDPIDVKQPLGKKLQKFCVVFSLMVKTINHPGTIQTVQIQYVQTIFTQQNRSL